MLLNMVFSTVTENCALVGGFVVCFYVVLCNCYIQPLLLKMGM